MRLQTVFTLKQPLSHIGDSESATVFLNTIKIVNAENKAEDIFAYNGNALRGALRDCSARYLLNALGVKVKKQMFNILFSGGNISGNLCNDIDQAAKYRELLPMISLLGAGVGNQILAGKISQTFALPVCAETKHIITETNGINPELFEMSWRKMTGTISFNRTDDLKNVNLNKYAVAEEDKEKEPQQMRYEVEYYAPGTQLFHKMEIADANTLEIGALMAALYEFSENPVLGGMSSKGFGLCSVEMFSENQRVVKIEDGIELSHEMAEAFSSYNTFLAEKRAEIIEFIGGVKV
ncbi:MAG: hypothetical protein ACI4KR_04795 [Ruminiclostridium sp.]